MKTFLHLFILLFSLSAFSQATTYEWAKSIGGQNYDDANSITLDPQGNVYVTGRFQKYIGTEVDFDPGPGVYNIAAIGQYDAFVLKLNSNGEFLWAKNFGGGGVVSGNSITVDSAGNVYTTGTFSYNCDFDPSPTADYTLTAINQFGNAATDVFISKLDSNGNFIWAKRLGSQFFETGVAITSDTNNNIYVTGKFAGTVNFDTSGGTSELTSVSSSSGFILKIAADGSFGWAKSISGSGTEVIYAVTVDNTGNVYATGNFKSATDLDPGAAVYTISGSGAYILKLDATGNFIFAKGFVGDSNIYCAAIKVDSNKNIFVTGSFQQNVDFDPGIATFNLFANGATTGQDVFLAKLDNLGNFVWAKKIYSTSSDFSRNLDLDNLGNIYIAPTLNSAAFYIDNSPKIVGSTSNPYLMAILKFDTTGTLLAKNFIDDISEIVATAIAVDTNFNVHTCGNFGFSTDFNPDPPIFNLTSNGYTDGFISKMKLRNETLNTTQNTVLNNVIVYPNPAGSTIHLNMSNAIENGTLKIISLTGQTVLENHNLSGTDFNFNVSGLNQGIYMVQLTNGNGILNSKFIKK